MPPCRQREENPPLKAGFCTERLEESLPRAGWPHRAGKALQTVLKATGSAAEPAGRAEEACNLSACNNQRITPFLRNTRYVSAHVHWPPCSALCQSFLKDLLSRSAKVQAQTPSTLSYRKRKATISLNV